MRKQTTVFLLILFFLAPPLSSQNLVTWQELLDAEIHGTAERFSVGEDSLQFADLWMPGKQHTGPHPTIILIHGGCWQGQYPGVALTNPMAEALASEGFAVWNIEYRRLGHGGGGYPGTFLDVAAAADFLPSVADQYNLDLSTIVAAGHSAGGHLATWLALRSNIPADSELYTEDPLPVHHVISLAGINDLERYAQYASSPCGVQTVEKLVDLDRRADRAYRDTSPVELLPHTAGHTEIAAAFDSPVPPFFGRGFVKDVNTSGGSARLILQANAGHFEMTAPWSREWNQVTRLFRSAFHQRQNR